MAYPDNLLADDEYVVVHKHPHWKRLIGPVVALLIVVALATFGASLVAATAWARIGWGVIAVVGVVLLLWRTVAPLLRWRTTHFVVTTQRLMYREGVFTRNGIDIPLARINSVRFQHGLLDRMLGCGTLIVESASEEPLEFADIPGAERVHTALYREMGAEEGWDEHDRGGRR